MINHIEISQPDITQDDSNLFSLHNTMKTVILDHTQYVENKLTDSIIQAAKEAGINELYLIDRDEVKRAIVEYMERKNSITNQAQFHVKELNVSVYVDKNAPIGISKLLAQQFEDVIAPYIIMQEIPDEQAGQYNTVRYQGTLKLLIRDTPEKV